MLDDTPLKFGKYRGRTPNAVSVDDPSYIVWLRENVRPFVVSKGLADDCEHDVREAAADHSYEEEAGYYSGYWADMQD